MVNTFPLKIRLDLEMVQFADSLGSDDAQTCEEKCLVWERFVFISEMIEGS
jgi:hypothetical protein